jgi:uncharacterized protein (TIGR02145 family)
MKKKLFTLLIILLAITGLHAQDLQIHKTDGTIITVPLNTVDSITFIESGNNIPVAGFTGNPTIGIAPLTVSFTDQSINNPTSWQWDFGDGTTSTGQNPIHTYNTVGIFTVQLTVANANGSDIEVKSDFINVTSGLITWYVPGDYVEASYPGAGFTNWTPGNSPFIKGSATNPFDLEGYVYMANVINEWKLTNGPSWDVNYGSFGGGVLVSNGPNIISPAGYYKLNVNFSEFTYTAVATVWGVIGSASPGGWSSETLLTYEPESRTWRGGIPMVAGEFKFRANQDWAYNYGAPAGSNHLEADGPSIPIDLAADYYFILDLSQPQDYTFSANRWGLIGSATPGGWGTDTDMIYDQVSQSMKVTLDLIVGEIKFRANDDWAINLGGDLNNLVQGGANIPITEAGNYTINLYLSGDGGYCTITNNSGSFTCGFSTITDIGGNIYNTVLIGNQCWMKENLKTTKYRNSTAIEYPGTDNSAWQNNTTGAYAWFENDINWKDSYGALYNWHAVNNTNGLCPTGWHVPSDVEWTQLVDYVVAQGFPNEWDNPNGAGNALKSCRQVNSPLGGDCNTTVHPRWEEDIWSGYNHHGFDEFGFSAFPGGLRYSEGYFNSTGFNGGMWSSSEDIITISAWIRFLHCSMGDMVRGPFNKNEGWSVRCLRDNVRTED